MNLGNQDGASIVTGGKTLRDTFSSGLYVEPGVFNQAKSNIQIVRKKIFGPVTTPAPFDDLDEVIIRGYDTV